MQIILLIIFLIAIVAILSIKDNYATVKGIMGENKVADILTLLPKDKYIVLNDLFFKSGDYSTQIDHLVISIYGIYVIETKNYSGWVFGNSHKDKWIKNMWGNKYHFFNPIFQNESHIKFLKRNFKEFNSLEDQIHPIVLFLNTSKLVLKGDCRCVLRENQLLPYINSFQKEVLNWEYCQQVYIKLSEANIADIKLREKHVDKVIGAKDSFETKLKNGICPRCGGKLILRNGRYGDFYGCSNFPSCRYTLNTDRV